MKTYSVAAQPTVGDDDTAASILPITAGITPSDGVPAEVDLLQRLRRRRDIGYWPNGLA